MNATEATKLSEERDNQVNNELRHFVEEGGMTLAITEIIREAALNGRYQVYFGTIEHAVMQKFISRCLSNNIFANPEGKIVSTLPPGAYLEADQRQYISKSIIKHLSHNGYYIRYNEYDAADAFGAAIIAWGKDAEALKKEAQAISTNKPKRNVPWYKKLI